MKRKIYIFGHTGYIGSSLLKSLNDVNFETIGCKIPRPNSSNLENFYIDFIKDFLDKNKNIFCIINAAGSINCASKVDYFFNSKFDAIFQSLLTEKKIDLKYLSFNSTKIFTNCLDKYALSKKDLSNNFKSKKNFYTLYVDLVFDDNSPHFYKIKETINKIKLFFIPVFYPGKIFYPIDLDSLIKTIKEILFENFKIHNFIIVGNKKINFNELIEHVNKAAKINKKILYIPSQLINLFPSFLKKILLKSKFFQQYENYDWLKTLDTDKYLIRKPNNKF